jgi:hypothetical protein
VLAGGWRRLRDDPSRVAFALILLPFVVTALHLIFGVGDAYLPTQDHAVTEMHVRDIGHHPVLIGLYSRADWSHPGPMLFYVLAPFYWLSGGASIGLDLGALVVNAASVTASAVLARRLGGTPALLCTLVALALLLRTLGPEFLADPWNTFIPVLPYLLLLFLTWSLLAGDTRALAPAAVVATFTAQTHVGFVLLALPLLAVGAAALIVPILRSTDEARERRPRVLRATGISAALLTLLWLPPILDIVVSAPSNVRQTIEWFQRADQGTHTLVEGWRVMAAQFALRPEWLTGKQPASFMTGEPPVIATAPLPVLLVVVLCAAVALWRRPIAAGRALVVTLGLATFLGIVAIARTVGPAYDYRLRWTWMVPTLALALVLWAAWLLVTRWRPWTEARLLLPAAMVALVVLAVVNTTAAARAGTPDAADSDVMTALSGPVLDAFADDGGAGGQVVVDRAAMSIGSLQFSRGLVLQLERHGIDARVPASRIRFLPESRNQTDGPVRARLVVATDEQIDDLLDDPDLRLLSIWSPVPPAERQRLQRRLDRLTDDVLAHRLTRVAFLGQAADINARLHSHQRVVVYAAAVFLDDSVDAVDSSG